MREIMSEQLDKSSFSEVLLSQQEETKLASKDFFPNILLIDDEEWNLCKLKELFTLYNEREGRFDYAPTFEDALTYLQEYNYSGIVTDFNMDLLNGKQVLRFIKGDYNEFTVDEEDVTLEDITSFDPDIGNVIDDNFDTLKQYISFTKRFSKTNFVLFSSTPFGDHKPDPILEDVYVQQKNNRSHSDYSAEIGIMRFFLERRVLRPAAFNEFMNNLPAEMLYSSYEGPRR